MRLRLFLFAHELESIDEYSTTVPTATTIGKVWKRNDGLRCTNGVWSDGGNPKWVVGMYVEHEDPKLVRILWFDVVMRSGPAPRYYEEPDWSNFAAWKEERRQQREAARR